MEDDNIRRQTYIVEIRGQHKRFTNFEHLIRSRGLNGAIELSGVHITRWQIDGLKDYLKFRDPTNFFNKVDEYECIIVDSYINSDISL